MTAFSEATRSVSTRRVRLWSLLLLLLIMSTSALMQDRKVSGQTPGPQALGPYAADFLLQTGGALDGTGAGARSLATGGPGYSITTATTCFTAWCGTLTVTAPVLLAAYTWWHQRNVQSVVPPGDPPVWWYNDGTYYFQVDFNDYAGFSTQYSCAGFVTRGTALYYVNFRSAANITCPNGQYWDGAGNPTTYRVKGDQVGYLWSQFRGAGGLNVSVPPNQNEANVWARTWIDLGRWGSAVKPALDAVIRAAVGSADFQALGITANPPFDEPPQVRKIAIDAGHGLQCPDAPPAGNQGQGTTGPTYGDLERVLVLEIAKQVAADFRARGHTVIETRPTDQCVVLRDRVLIAINEQAEVFVSIHLNGDDDRTIRGTEAWYDPRFGEPSARSLAMARLAVQEQMRLPLPTHGSGATGEPGIKLADGSDGGPFVVLSVATNEGQLPAIIDEVAYLTNIQFEEPLLHDPNFRRRAANAIGVAIRRFP